MDAPAINALIVSGISCPVLASRTSGNVIGLATEDEATRTRIETAVCTVVQQTHGAA